MAGPKRDTLKNIFYEEATDAQFKFSNGKLIKINKAILAARHDAFYEMLFKNSQDTIEINDFDFDTFKLFLDCLMGFKKCSVTDALLIFPIAGKYKIEEFIEGLVEILKPKQLTETVCISLNLAIFYNVTALVDHIINFLTKEFEINKLLDDEKLCILLEPESMLALLDSVDMDSWIYGILCKWGNNYIKIHNKRSTLRQFFEDCKIMDKISLDSFETLDSIFKFTENDVTSGFFTEAEILTYLRKKIYSEKKSEWFKIKDGVKIVEVFAIDNVYFPKDYSVNLFFKRNNAVFYDFPISKDVADLINYEIIWKYLDDKSDDGFNFYSFNEVELSKSFKSEYFRVKIKDAGQECLLKEIKISYEFNANCRVLKKTPEFGMDVFFDNSLLYFTGDIFYEMKKIQEENEPKAEDGFFQRGAEAAKWLWSMAPDWPLGRGESGGAEPTSSTTSEPTSSTTFPTTTEVGVWSRRLASDVGSTCSTKTIIKVKRTSPLMKALKDIKKEK